MEGRREEWRGAGVSGGEERGVEGSRSEWRGGEWRGGEWRGAKDTCIEGIVVIDVCG